MKCGNRGRRIRCAPGLLFAFQNLFVASLFPGDSGQSEEFHKLPSRTVVDLVVSLGHRRPRRVLAVRKELERDHEGKYGETSQARRFLTQFIRGMYKDYALTSDSASGRRLRLASIRGWRGECESGHIRLLYHTLRKVLSRLRIHGRRESAGSHCCRHERLVFGSIAGSRRDSRAEMSRQRLGPERFRV